MKKLIIFLGLILMSAAIFAQVTAVTRVSKVLRSGVTYYKYTGTALDTCGYEQDTLYYEVLSNKNTPLTCNARVEADTIGSGAGSENYGARLQGKVFENDSWANISPASDSIKCNSGASLYELETSMVDSTGVADAMPGSGDNYYRYFRVFINNDGTCAKGDRLNVNAVIFKFYER